MSLRQVVYVAPGTNSVSSAVLNDWFNFVQIGTYQIDVSLSVSANGSSSAQTFPTQLTLTVLPLNEASLMDTWRELATRVQNMKSAEDAATAADALTKVNDPSVVPFLAEVMGRNTFAPMMIAALARLKTPEALRVLDEATRSRDPETSTLARNALLAIAQAPGHR